VSSEYLHQFLRVLVGAMLNVDLLCPCRFIPRYFENDWISGVPTLTAEGRKAVDEELNETWSSCIEGSGEEPS
jgi:hypothetical protein